MTVESHISYFFKVGGTQSMHYNFLKAVNFFIKNVVAVSVYYKNDDDSDDEEEELDAGISSLVAGNKNNKIVVANVNSMRIDAVVKAGMGIPRNQAETAFYESKLRVNGHKVLKKGHQIGLEDEIDYIHGPSPNNPDFLLVTRLTVLNANNQEDGYKIKLLREKSLTIENYDDRVKSSSEES
ncbi:mitochondrial transcription rescue factor 1 isoform X2 [Microplitis mediator]|uniref:mitochondrial transcription rescue factor 1 isoform X2 n=1 Tax=Microplitis mediator TaxID=375433 RepID=UPI0025529C56|nr:mitochondrial transcription rescue factor 1 isoform X2 [Microplitis mediator]